MLYFILNFLLPLSTNPRIDFLELGKQVFTYTNCRPLFWKIQQFACSEYMFLDNSACNLASLNLMKFLRDDALCRFLQLIDLSGVDWPARAKRFPGPSASVMGTTRSENPPARVQ